MENAMASAELPPPAPTKNTVDPPPSPAFNLIKADLTLRLLLFAAALVAMLAMVTGNQTVLFDTPFSPFPLALDAKFNYSPAFIYFVTAQSVACFYSLLTAAVSALSISKPSPAAKLLLYLAFADALLFGVMASATGAGASIAYVGLKGNSHVRWTKVCNIYGKFCRHVASSLIISLVASIILVLLVMISVFSLYNRRY